MTTPLVTRSDAGLRAPTAAYQRIAPEGITVHYAGPSPWTPAGNFVRAREASIWRADQAYHMDTDAVARGGAIDIAYTSGVGPSGTRYEGRPAWARTAANGSNEGNGRSLAVCYLAGVGDRLTDDAKWAFLDEAGRLGVPLRWPHRHWFNTQCPGDPLLEWVNAGFPPPGHAPSVPPIPIILPPRSIAAVRLAPMEGDEGPMARKTFDCGVLDGQGSGAILFDGGANGDPKIAHLEAVPWAKARSPMLVGPYPPADGHKGGAPAVLWQQRDGFVCVDFEGGAPGRGVVVTIDVAD